MPSQIVTIRDSMYSAFTVFMNFIPTLIGGVLLLIVGWMISSLVARMIEKVLKTLKVDHASDRSGLSQFMVGPQGHFTVSYGIGFLSKWFIRLLFIQAVANLFEMPQITTIMTSILMLIPNLAVGLLIIVAGLYFGQFVANLVQETTAKAGMSRPGVIALICRYGIVGFSLIAALNHVGIAAVAINVLYMGFVGSLALALGLAFGLGGQGVAAEVTRTWYDQNKPPKLTAVPIRPQPKSVNESHPTQTTSPGPSPSTSDPDVEKPAAIF